MIKRNSSRRCSAAVVALFVASAILSGCGGNGGTSGSTSTVPANGPVTTTTQVVTFWAFDTVLGVSSPVSNAPGLEAVLNSASIVPGKFGNAVQFDSALPISYAVINVNLQLANAGRSLVFPDNKISVSMWINPTMLAPNATYQLFGGGHFGVQSFHVTLVDGKITFALANVNNGAPDPILSSQSSVAPGVWTHIAVIYDGSSAKILIDGTVDATNSIVHPISDVINDLYVGGIGDGSAPLTFPGSIDELLLTATSLSGTQVAQLISGYRP